MIDVIYYNIRLKEEKREHVKKCSECTEKKILNSFTFMVSSLQSRDRNFLK